MLKLYYLLLKKWFHRIKYMRYNLDIFKILIKERYFRVRDEGNTNKRLKTFRPYLSKENIEKFLSKLDTHGRKSWELLIKKIEQITYNNILPYRSLFTKEEIHEQQKFSKFCLQNKDSIPFPLHAVGSYLNYFYMRNFSEEHHHLDVQGKDIIDCWWYNGDSALAMNNYFKNTGNIYCIEPEEKNYKDIKNIIQSQNTKNIIPIKVWLWSKRDTATISEWWAGSNLSTDSDKEGEKIEIETIDNIVQANSINPWLIKWDIEWYEYESIRWAKNTIKKHKPILLISIYHTGKDRFEILQLIDSRNLGYKFTLRRRNCFHPFADTLLVCY